MKTELEKFNHTIGVLVKAYFENTLIHSICTACAVGNIIADSMGLKINTEQEDAEWISDGWCQQPKWQEVFMTRTGGKQIIYTQHLYGAAKEQIDSTGYTWEELARIESAFESADGDKDNDLCPVWMFNGLMDVVTVLADIHNIDLETTEASRKLFVKI